MSTPDYDYIITGAGCAGLSLLAHWIHSGGPGTSSVLLLDRAPKDHNDRTWCFWEKGEGLFEPIVCRSWDRLWFHGEDYSGLKELHPYTYKMIRGIDFYNYCFERIRSRRNIDVLYGEVERLHSEPGKTFVIVDGRKITARYIFNSILPPARARDDGHILAPGEMSVPGTHHWHLLQHFKGWVIRSSRAAFQPGVATLMDFRVSQEDGAAFVYVMPFSESEALAEYTLFSEKLLEPVEYDRRLKDYIRDVLLIGDYTILEEEFGVIPMTDRPFPSRKHNIIYIGTAGGRTKPSSGYTFQFIQRQSRAILQALPRTGTPFLNESLLSPAIAASPGRFRFYDGVMLNVLATGKIDGRKIFTDLFRRNKITDIFRFLDNETNWSRDLRIIGSLPFRPFLRAGGEQLARFIRKD